MYMYFSQVRLQVQNKRFQGRASLCFQNILRNEGVRSFLRHHIASCFNEYSEDKIVFQVWGLYKGVMSPIYGQAFLNAIVFGVHANTLRHITHDKTDIKANFVAGFAAGKTRHYGSISSQTLRCNFLLFT